MVQGGGKGSQPALTKTLRQKNGKKAKKSNQPFDTPVFQG